MDPWHSSHNLHIDHQGPRVKTELVYHPTVAVELTEKNGMQRSVMHLQF